MSDGNFLGGVSSSHPALQPFPILLAPATAKERNKIRMELIPVACWKLNDVRFAFGSSFVLPESRTEFVELAMLRRAHPGAPLSIFGHADPTGDEAFNKNLSGNRAEAVYAVLTRDVAIWETLYTTAGTSEGWGQPSIQSMAGALGHDTVSACQEAAGLTQDGVAGPLTRAKLFPAYMDFLCPETLSKTNFLSRGQDSKGKGDYQGCSEFNPAMVFSAAEYDELSKSRRDEENGVNRRVMALLFRPGSVVPPDKWPCPRTNEGDAACKKRFWSDAETRRSPRTERREFSLNKDTFGCRFYHRLVVHSPCESVDPVPAMDEVGPLIDQLAGQAAIDLEGTPRSGVSERSNVLPSKPAELDEDEAVAMDAAPSPVEAGRNGGTPNLIGPASGYVLVRKNLGVGRQLFQLRVDKTFDGKGTLTVSPPGVIDFFGPGGDPDTPMRFDGDHIFDGKDLSSKFGVLVFAEGREPSKSKDDITVTLTLSGGSKKLKGPAKMTVTSVELRLEIAEPVPPGTTPKALPEADKLTKGVTLFRQDDPLRARRAALIVYPPKPKNLDHNLLLHTLSGRVEIFKEQTPAGNQTPTSGVISIKSASIPAAGKRFFAEGRFPSLNPAEEQFHLGIDTGNIGTIINDSVAATVVEQHWKGKLFYNRTWDHDTAQPAPAVKEFLPNNKVELHGRLTGTSNEILVATGSLDDEGAFEFKMVPELETAFFRIFLEHKDNKVCRVKGQAMGGSSTPVNLPDFKIRAGEIVRFDHVIDPALFKGMYGELDFSEVEVKHARFIMYCDAYVSIVFGHKRMKELTKNSLDPKLCTVLVPQNPKTDTSDADGGEIRLLESDVQDRDVILHEYGHFIADTVLGHVDFPGYTFNDEPLATAGHYSGRAHPFAAEHYESAWIEGHATFISCALRKKPTYKDGHEGPNDTNPKPQVNLTDTHTTWGGHNESPVQEMLWRIWNHYKVPFKEGFWTAFLEKPSNVFEFFESWKRKGCPDVAKVVEAYVSRGMEFGFEYPAGAGMFTMVDAHGSFDAAKQEFNTVDELFANFGNVNGDTSGTKAEYEMEFYNRNRLKNPSALGAGSRATVDRATRTLNITINLVPGRRYIVPRRIQVKV